MNIFTNVSSSRWCQSDGSCRATAILAARAKAVIRGPERLVYPIGDAQAIGATSLESFGEFLRAESVSRPSVPWEFPDDGIEGSSAVAVLPKQTLLMSGQDAQSSARR